MSEKSLRGAGPGADQAAEPAVPGGEQAADTGGAPVEPWAGLDSTERVPPRDGANPRVALVPASAPADSQVPEQVPEIDTTKRVVDSGRTTLMGVPSPFADRDKPTAPGHDVHLPAEKTRLAGARPVASPGVVPAVDLDPSSTRRIGKIEQPGQAPGALVPNERSIAAAAATFRAAAKGAGEPPGREPDEEPQRPWVADRTQEFHLDAPAPPPKSPFAKNLSVGVALAVGAGLLVQGLIHSRGRTGEPAEEVHSASPPVARALPPPPPSLPPALPPTNLEAAPGALPVEPDTAPVPPLEPTRDPVLPDQAGTDTGDVIDGPKLERRLAPRAKPLVPAGRPAPLARPLRPAVTAVRPGVSPVPGAMPGTPKPTTAPVGGAPATAPTAPPPLATTPVERPVRPEPQKAEPAARPAERPAKAEPGAKPYDPDMPLPPSSE